MENVGEIIRRQRIKKGLTQEALGEKLFVTKQAVSKWENGRSLPDVEMLRKLCQLLEIGSDEILGGTVNNAKMERKRLSVVSIVLVVVLLCLSLKLPGFIQRRLQFGVTTLTIWEDGVLIPADEYEIESSLSVANEENAYSFKTGYGAICGVAELDEVSIEFGFVNTNNWHNIQIRLDIVHGIDETVVKQTVIYQTDNDRTEVHVTESTVLPDGHATVLRSGL